MLVTVVSGQRPFLGQVGGMLGVQTSGGGTIQKFASALQQLPQASIPTVIISLVVLLILTKSDLFSDIHS